MILKEIIFIMVITTIILGITGAKCTTVIISTPPPAALTVILMDLITGGITTLIKLLTIHRVSQLQILLAVVVGATGEPLQLATPVITATMITTLTIKNIVLLIGIQSVNVILVKLQFRLNQQCCTRDDFYKLHWANQMSWYKQSQWQSNGYNMCWLADRWQYNTLECAKRDTTCPYHSAVNPSWISGSIPSDWLGQYSDDSWTSSVVYETNGDLAASFAVALFFVGLLMGCLCSNCKENSVQNGNAQTGPTQTPANLRQPGPPAFAASDVGLRTIYHKRHSNQFHHQWLNPSNQWLDPCPQGVYNGPRITGPALPEYPPPPPPFPEETAPKVPIGIQEINSESELQEYIKGVSKSDYFYLKHISVLACLVLCRLLCKL